MIRLALTIALLVGATAAYAQPVFMVPLEGTCYFKTNTLDASGEPVTITGTGAVEVWEGGNTTPITAADTVTEDYTDNGATSHTGMHDIAIACTAANGFEVGKYYSVAWSDDTLTADSVAIDDRVIAHIYISATINVSSGVVEANVKQVNGTTQTAGDVTALVTTVDNVADAILDDTGTSGVRLSVGTGTGQISLSSGGVSLANTNITTVVGALWNANIGLYSGTPNSTAEAVAGIWADTNAVDTQTEMRTFLTGADSPVLAEDNLPSNFSSLEINGSGAVDSMVQGFVDSTIAESTLNNIATNFEVFFDNGDAVSTSVIDDVQSGGLDAAGVRAALGMAAADLDTQLDGIVGYVDDIGVAGANLTAIPWNASWDAEVQSEAQDALTASIGANGASLSAIPWNATWDAEVQSEATDALTAYDPPTDTEMDAQFSAIDTKLGTPSTSIAGDIASISSGTGYAKDNVDSSRVWTFPKNWKSSKSPVTIIENASFNGTLKFDLTNRINEGAGALTITSVTCDPSDGITLGTPVKTSDNKGVMVSASGFESGVTYTFTVTHSTTDSDTALVSTGDFKAE